jgi:hypothetical protein
MNQCQVYLICGFVCRIFFGFSDVDFVYILGRHEGVAYSSFHISSDNEGFPSCRSPCRTEPRGKFCFMFMHPK